MPRGSIAKRSQNTTGGGSGSAVTPFRLIYVPDAITTSGVFVDLMNIPNVAILANGNILVDFDASVETIISSPGFTGAQFQYLWDGVAVGVVQSFVEFDPGAGVAPASYSVGTRMRTIIAANAGNHTLQVQWLSIDATSSVQTFAENGALSIQGT
jgi:hypothetical protein